MTKALLQVRDLRTHFETRAGTIKAVDGISFTLERGEILGLVGESGSGKSVTGFSLIGLLDAPGRIAGGSVLFRGQELVGLPQAEMRKLRGKRIAMIFQDPAATLNPVLTIGQQMVMAVQAHGGGGEGAALALAERSLARVGIPDAAARLNAYPHEFSGGQRQRIVIARALATNPKLIICDEAVAALDVSVQAQVLNLLNDLKAEYNLTYLFISHDLRVVHYMSDRIMVMRKGCIEEIGEANNVFNHPTSDYTRQLLDAIPGK